MKDYALSVRTKDSDEFMRIVKDISKYDCEILIDKVDQARLYSFEFAERSYQKLGERRGRTVTQYKKDMLLYKYIGNILKSFGLQEQHKGFKYSIECVRLINVYGLELYSLDKDVYPVIAKWYDATPTCIEHNIRNSITKAWDRFESGEESENLEMNIFKQKPSNLIFLRHIANIINKTIVNANY